MTAVVPGVDRLVDFIRLIDAVDCLLNVPETEKYVKICSCGGIEGAYCSIETFCPIPPTSPWNPIREGSNGLDSIE